MLCWLFTHFVRLQSLPLHASIKPSGRFCCTRLRPCGTREVIHVEVVSNYLFMSSSASPATFWSAYMAQAGDDTDPKRCTVILYTLLKESLYPHHATIRSAADPIHSQVLWLDDKLLQYWPQGKEYLCHLQKIQNWIRARENYKVGDVVLIHVIADNSRPKNSWQLGRVTSTMPREDGLVRQVQVKTKNPPLVRPVAKLCLLLEADNHDKEPEETRASNEAWQESQW